MLFLMYVNFTFISLKNIFYTLSIRLSTNMMDRFNIYVNYVVTYYIFISLHQYFQGDFSFFFLYYIFVNVLHFMVLEVIYYVL